MNAIKQSQNNKWQAELATFPKKREQLCYPNLTEYIFNITDKRKKVSENTTEHLTKSITMKVPPRNGVIKYWGWGWSGEREGQGKGERLLKLALRDPNPRPQLHSGTCNNISLSPRACSGYIRAHRSPTVGFLLLQHFSYFLLSSRHRYM